MRASRHGSALAPTVLILVAAWALPGCSDDESLAVFEVYEPEPGTPEAIAYERGITRYIGLAPPVETAHPLDSVTTYTFDPADGPMCLRGDPFRASVRSGSANDLLIFLQGGGACWSEFCLAINKAPYGVPNGDLLDPYAPYNPLADWDVLYLPYCDGSLFSGDSEVDDDMDGVPDRFHHGLWNVSAALVMGYAHFPKPDRIVLAGSSGGGYGTILASYLVRYVYPDVPIYVFNDSGVGLGKPGDPTFLDTLIGEFGAEEFIPPDCVDCTADGHITSLIDYLLDRDPNLRVGAITSWYDYVITQIFMQIDPAAFRDALMSETGALAAEHPDQYRRFIFDGQAHTALLGDVSGIIGNDLTSVELPPDVLSIFDGLEIESVATATAGGVSLESWLRAMVDDDLAGWQDVMDTPGPAPVP